MPMGVPTLSAGSSSATGSPRFLLRPATPAPIAHVGVGDSFLTDLPVSASSMASPASLPLLALVFLPPLAPLTALPGRLPDVLLGGGGVVMS